MFGPMISGALIEDSDDPSRKNISYLTILFSLWLHTLMTHCIEKLTIQKTY